MNFTAKELRIGNIVHDYIGNIRPVTGQDISNFEAGKDKFVPVDLTVDILIKFGFSKQKYTRNYEKFWDDDNGLVQLRVIDEEIARFELYSDGIILSRPIAYMHELQNLYYCLTGEELPVSGMI